MDDLREGLSGRLADLHTRAVMRARIRSIRDADRRDTWMNVANRQLESRLAQYQTFLYSTTLLEQDAVEWAPPDIPDPVEAPVFQSDRTAVRAELGGVRLE